MLSQEQQQTVMETLERNGVSPSCPACGNQERMVSDNPVFLPGGTNEDAPTMPSVVISCDRCGNLSLFYAEDVGIDLDDLRE